MSSSRKRRAHPVTGPRPHILPLASLVLFLGACGGGSGSTAPTAPAPQPGASTGAIEATTATTGQDLDPDGYTLTLDGSDSLHVGTDSTVTFARVAAGDHTLTLSGATKNCPVNGSDPRSVTVVAGDTAKPTFQLSCSRAELIAFESDSSGADKLWTMRTDGSYPTRITGGPDVDGPAEWSPDGTQLVFLRQTNSADEIWAVGADGSNPTRLIQGTFVRSPTWSPDGTRIAFIKGSDDSHANIWVMGADGSNPTNLTQDQSTYGPLDWSPDGSRLLFESSRTGSTSIDIWVIDADGSNPTDLTNTAGFTRFPRWSPDGSTIAYVNNAALNELELRDADGSNPRVLADSIQFAAPRWSPDGTRIAFLKNGNTALDIWTIASDGTGETDVTRGAAIQPDHPRWSPDGTRIAFDASNQQGTIYNVWVIGADGSNPTRLTDVSGYSGHPEWRP